MTADALSRAQRGAPLVIQATRGWRALEFGELWRARELLWFLAIREIKGRYRQMAFGVLWILIRPVVTMIIFTLLFGKLADLPSEGIPYPLFVFAALVPWTFFGTSLDASARSLVVNMGLISKVYFPRLVVPLASAMSALLDLAFALLVLAVLMAAFGVVPSIQVVFLPLFVLAAGMTAIAIGLWTAALAVKFRDLLFAVTYGLQAWLFATPVAYSGTLIPERWQPLYQLNPMYWVIEGFRWSLLDTGQAPEPYALIPLAMVIALLVSGAYVFRRAERTIVDLL